MSKHNKHNKKPDPAASFDAAVEEKDNQTLTQVQDAWIETYRGTKFHFFDQNPDELDIEDIAHALSNIARYCGHTQKFLSVAEHSVLMARWLEFNGKDSSGHMSDPEHCLTALLHDAPEAYVGDMTRPLKAQFPLFRELEDGIHAAVAKRYGTEWPHPAWLKTLDMRILKDEREQAMSKQSRNEWGLDDVEPLGVALQFWTPAQAKGEFLGAFRRYSTSV